MVGNKLKITFISGNVYPDTSASAIRQSNYFRGLAELGHNVTILTYTKQEDTHILGKIKMVDKGLNHLNKLDKFKNRIISFKNCKKYLKEQKKNNDIDLLVILSIDFFSVSYFIKCGKQLNIPISHERTEYPFVNKPQLPLSNLFLQLYLRLLIPQFNGIYVINKALINYFRKYIKSNCLITEILTVVDNNAFLNKQIGIYNFTYFAYCGTIYGEKDGVTILIEAFKRFSINHPEVKLLIIGNNSDKDKMKIILKKVTNFENKIVFTGFLKRNEISNVLNNANALLLARPANKQAEGGFPSKLGEYLATGNPVVVTDVGEISDYLTDGVNAFIAKPGSIFSFHNKLEEVYYNYDRAIEIGHKGKQVASNIFDYRVQSFRLSLFFLEIIKLHNKNEK